MSNESMFQDGKNYIYECCQSSEYRQNYKGHRKIANKARLQYFTDKHDTIWSKYYVLHISNHEYVLVKSTKNVFIAQEKGKMLKKSYGCDL